MSWTKAAGLLGVLGLFAGLELRAQEAATVLPPAVREAREGRHYNVAVTSGDERTATLLRTAIGAHGGFTLTEPGRAQFTFRVEPAGENRATLQIFSGQPPQMLFEQTLRGASAVDALYRAADRAVEKSLGLPGIFGGELLFVSDRGESTEVYRADLFFQAVRQVTRDGSVALTPRWSPDGRQMLYTSFHRTGFPDIFRVNLETGRRDLFASYKGTNQGAVFSPDGRTVAMILSAPGNPEVYLASANGKNLKRLTRNSGIEQTPAWSPEGNRLLFTSDRLGGPQIYVMDLEKGVTRRVPTNISGYCAEPHWNPRNADQILFTAATAGTFQIALFDFSTGQAKFLTGGPSDNVEPHWLRDGRHAVMTRRTGDGRGKRLYLLDTLTGKSAPLHSARFGNASQPSWVYRP